MIHPLCVLEEALILTVHPMLYVQHYMLPRSPSPAEAIYPAHKGRYTHMMKDFRHKVTGVIARFPEHLAELYDYLEPVCAEDVTCTDCAISLDEEDFNGE